MRQLLPVAPRIAPPTGAPAAYPVNVTVTSVTDHDDT